MARIRKFPYPFNQQEKLSQRTDIELLALLERVAKQQFQNEQEACRLRKLLLAIDTQLRIRAEAFPPSAIAIEYVQSQNLFAET